MKKICDTAALFAANRSIELVSSRGNLAIPCVHGFRMKASVAFFLTIWTGVREGIFVTLHPTLRRALESRE